MSEVSFTGRNCLSATRHVPCTEVARPGIDVLSLECLVPLGCVGSLPPSHWTAAWVPLLPRCWKRGPGPGVQQPGLRGLSLAPHLQIAAGPSQIPMPLSVPRKPLLSLLSPISWHHQSWLVPKPASHPASPQQQFRENPRIYRISSVCPVCPSHTLSPDRL